jgi:G6PDH family F420-dependent oxidoreductase
MIAVKAKRELGTMFE